jgi:hypothetical protein
MPRALVFLAAVLVCSVLPSSVQADTPVPTAVQTKWATELYGFVELDAIHDSTESYSEPAGNAALAKPGTFGAGHGRTMFAVRNSRLGFKLSAPELFQVKASAQLEMDFLGNQPSATEAQLFNNPSFRIRRFFLKLEDPFVDVLAGQEWQLFGWQSMFNPNSVDIQGLPGQVYSRTPQVRLSHAFKSTAATVEIAAAAARPPQRDAEFPDGQAGVRLLLNQWRGIHTVGSTGTSEDAAALGVSGVMRKFNVERFEKGPKTAVSTMGWGAAVDLLLPIIPRTKEQKANALTLTGSYAIGAGIADLYTGLTGGLAMPTKLPSGDAFPANVDNGLVMYNAKGGITAVEWSSFILGLQYYLPPNGSVWISANFSQLGSNNARSLAPPAGVFDFMQWANGNIFWDVIPAVRLGLEYTRTQQRYGDRVLAHNDRVQLAAFYLF